MPFARLIYAPSLKVIIINLANILYFLLKKSILFIAVECNKDLCPRQYFFTNRSIKYYKGNIDTDEIDFAYSELVLFDF